MSGWRQILDAARAPSAALTDAIFAPELAQLALLRRIIDENSRTEFGRRHDFADIRALEDYRVAVPVQSYEAFRPFVERIAEGECGVLTRDPVIAFEETGGTSSGSKLIPYTAASLGGFRAAVLPWLADCARRRPGLARGGAYVSISPAARRPRATPAGIPIGLATEAAYLGDDLIGAFLSILAVPPDVAAILDVDDWRIATLAHLVEREDLSFVSVWSPTFFLELIEALPGVADKLASRLSPMARRRLTQALNRAPLDTTRLWPRLDAISCWADGSSRIFAARLAALCPQAAIEPKGLFATEAAITLPWRGGVGAIPALTSTFVEFIGDDGAPALAHELQLGAAYRVVVTTPGGLYRYDMGDLVRCVGHEGPVARLVFEGRTSLVSDLVGEKLEEAFVAGALGNINVAAVLVPNLDSKPHYELWLDGDCVETEEAGRRVESALRTNAQYAHARDIGQLGALVAVLKPGIFARRNHDRAMAGARMGDMKHASLLLDR